MAYRESGEVRDLSVDPEDILAAQMVKARPASGPSITVTTKAGAVGNGVSLRELLKVTPSPSSAPPALTS